MDFLGHQDTTNPVAGVTIRDGEKEGRNVAFERPGNTEKFKAKYRYELATPRTWRRGGC